MGSTIMSALLVGQSQHLQLCDDVVMTVASGTNLML